MCRCKATTERESGGGGGGTGSHTILIGHFFRTSNPIGEKTKLMSDITHDPRRHFLNEERAFPKN